MGSTLKIPVRVGGIPYPHVTWLKENKSLKTAGKITLDFQEESTTLTVKKISKEDDGLYTLSAENEVGEATAKFDVEVLGKTCVLYYIVKYIIIYLFKFLGLIM